MYTIILGFILGIATSVFMFFRKEERDGFDLFISCFVGAMIGGVVSLFTSFLLPVKLKTDILKTPLEALQDNGSVHGSFFLGSGYVGESMKYVYYSMNGDSSYSLHEVSHRFASVKYTDGPPFMEIHEPKIDKSDFGSRFALRELDNEWRVVFHVPRGSIKNDYNLNAQ